MKRLIGVLAFIAVVLVSLLATGFVTTNAPSTTSPRTTTMVIPSPVREALSVVEYSRRAGPLTVDPNAGSVVGGVWTSSRTRQSAGVTQHWSVLAADKKGKIVLGIIVINNGTEAVSGWVPGAHHSTSWMFNEADPSATVHQLTVAGTTTVWSSSPSSRS
ncbi:MAG TPA: hypothetical protein VLS91_01930 [Acidimicrobiales bacterium]|nr:hypothetical protein [Acidimicrobiales bacterium]